MLKSNFAIAQKLIRDRCFEYISKALAPTDRGGTSNKTGRLSAVIALAPVDLKEQIFPDNYAKAAIRLWAARHTKPNRLIDWVNFVQKRACRPRCECEMAMVDNPPLPSFIQVIEPGRTLAGEGFWEIYGNLAT